MCSESYRLATLQVITDCQAVSACGCVHRSVRNTVCVV